MTVRDQHEELLQLCGNALRKHGGWRVKSSHAEWLELFFLSVKAARQEQPSNQLVEDFRHDCTRLLVLLTFSEEVCKR